VTVAPHTTARSDVRMPTSRRPWLGLQRRVLLATAAAAVALPLAACGSGAVPASRAVADSAAASGNTAAANSAAVAPAAPTLVVGGRYETLPGTIVCPTAAALRRTRDVASQGDTAAFVKTLDDAGCAPVVTGAVVQVAEQQQALARVRRAGDTSTYWTSADKLSPR